MKQASYLSTDYEFCELLESSETAAVKDVKTFNRWNDGAITLEMAAYEFVKNNHIIDGIQINRTEFIKWVRSLGYRRVK